MKTSTSSNSSALPTLAAVALTCGLGLAALYQATLGFEVVSTEDARRLDIARQPRALPTAAIHLQTDAAVQALTLEQALKGDGRIAIVSFIYTSCNAVCTVLGSQFQQMQAAIRARGLQRQVRLLSISFDPHDTPPQLAAYAQRQRADAGVWQFVSVDNAAQRQALLDTFGIVVVPAPLGQFQHNAAFHLIDGDGRLALVDDYQYPDQALADAIAMAAQRATRQPARMAAAGAVAGHRQVSAQVSAQLLGQLSAQVSAQVRAQVSAPDLALRAGAKGAQ